MGPLPQPREDDLLALYAPADGHLEDPPRAPVKYEYAAAAGADYLQAGRGTLRLRLINLRTDMRVRAGGGPCARGWGWSSRRRVRSTRPPTAPPGQVVLVRGGVDAPTVVAEGPAIRNANPNEPTGIHLALSHRAPDMVVQWSTRDAGSPVVQYGTQRDKLVYLVPASSDTYSRDDMCGGTAAAEGFLDPGSLHTGIMTGLQPGQRYYYRVGDQVRWQLQRRRAGQARGILSGLPARPRCAGCRPLLRHALLHLPPRHRRAPERPHPGGGRRWSGCARLGSTAGGGSAARPRPAPDRSSMPPSAQASRMLRRRPWSTSPRWMCLGRWSTMRWAGRRTARRPTPSSCTTATSPVSSLGAWRRSLGAGGRARFPLPPRARPSLPADAQGYQALWDTFLHQQEPLAANMPYMTLPGNHEVDWPGMFFYKGADDSGAQGGGGAPGCFLGGWACALACFAYLLADWTPRAPCRRRVWDPVRKALPHAQASAAA